MESMSLTRDLERLQSKRQTDSKGVILVPNIRTKGIISWVEPETQANQGKRDCKIGLNYKKSIDRGREGKA